MLWMKFAVNILAYSDAQTHFGNTHWYFQFDCPPGLVFMSLPVLNHYGCWNDKLEDVTCIVWRHLTTTSHKWKHSQQHSQLHGAEEAV